MTNRVAAVILLRHDGAALLQHRDDKPGLPHAGMWVPPGGHAETGESMPDCARRELREETEYDAPDLRFLLSLEDKVEGWPAYPLTFFWCWYDGIQSFACHEGQALAFVERAFATDYPIPTHLIDVWDIALETAGTTMKTLCA
jgi:8-oxo-dGTP pyrophosphatase MutT (NUDIX family)